MITNKLKFSAIALIIVLTFFSCGYSKKDAQVYLPGTYTYEIPSGELQVLKINSDFTFEQTIYSDKNKENILYKNIGKMHVHNENIELEHWLEFYEHSEQKVLKSPYITYSTGIFWRKPTESENTLIFIFDETNYVFEKMK